MSVLLQGKNWQKLTINKNELFTQIHKQGRTLPCPPFFDDVFCAFKCECPTNHHHLTQWYGYLVQSSVQLRLGLLVY